MIPALLWRRILAVWVVLVWDVVEALSTIDSPHGRPQHAIQRRRRHCIALIPAATSALLAPVVVHAATATTAGEALRSTASSRLPSYYGPTDVFYPGHWIGSWQGTRTSVETGVTASYALRFIASLQEDAVVADRGFNQRNLEGTAMVANTVWTETNPNVLRVNYANGGWKELKVTQRATERTDTNVFSSEVYRVTKQSSDNGVPEITARRVLTKWRELSPSAVEALELVYDAQQQGDPKLLGKTRISLRR